MKPEICLSDSTMYVVQRPLLLPKVEAVSSSVIVWFRFIIIFLWWNISGVPCGGFCCAGCACSPGTNDAGVVVDMESNDHRSCEGPASSSSKSSLGTGTEIGWKLPGNCTFGLLIITSGFAFDKAPLGSEAGSGPCEWSSSCPGSAYLQVEHQDLKAELMGNLYLVFPRVLNSPWHIQSIIRWLSKVIWISGMMFSWSSLSPESGPVL